MNQGEQGRAAEATSGAAFHTHARAAWRAAAVLTLLSGGLAALALSDTVHAVLTDALTASHEVIAGHPVLGPVLFVVLAAASAMLAFASVTVLLPMAVFSWGEPLSILLLWTGWTLGGACTYLAGRFLRRTAVTWLAGGALLQRLEHYVGPSTPFGLVLLFQLALPSEVPGYVLGLARYSVGRYMLALCLVELLYTVAAVRVGASFLDRHAGTVFAAGIAAAVLSLTAFFLLRRRIQAQ
jgi:uncharacterized membrane protein YdjX (TVP38/TMEM64 family)